MKKKLAVGGSTLVMLVLVALLVATPVMAEIHIFYEDLFSSSSSLCGPWNAYNGLGLTSPGCGYATASVTDPDPDWQSLWLDFRLRPSNWDLKAQLYCPSSYCWSDWKARIRVRIDGGPTWYSAWINTTGSGYKTVEIDAPSGWYDAVIIEYHYKGGGSRNTTMSFGNFKLYEEQIRDWPP